jgi:hypothetical protein
MTTRLKGILKERRYSIGQCRKKAQKKDAQAQTPQTAGQNAPPEKKGQVMKSAPALQ